MERPLTFRRRRKRNETRVAHVSTDVSTVPTESLTSSVERFVCLGRSSTWKCRVDHGDAGLTCRVTRRCGHDVGMMGGATRGEVAENQGSKDR